MFPGVYFQPSKNSHLGLPRYICILYIYTFRILYNIAEPHKSTKRSDEIVFCDT